MNYTYQNRLRTALSLLQPGAAASPWLQGYSYDDAKRLAAITSPAGTFGYGYNPQQSTLVSLLSLPGGSLITNIYDAEARLLGTPNGTNAERVA